MDERIWVGTRKGLFSVERTGSGRWEIADSRFLGDPVSAVLSEAGGERIYAALDLGHFGAKMHRSEDGGVTWKEIAAPA
ncbi:MAG: hypothetical protein PVF40_10160, partial [Ectothiorhodospiraceae bacterium]